MGELLRRREIIGAANLPRKSFNLCTMAEINAICEAGQAQQYVDNGIWTIGDTNANASYGSYSGVRLVHVLTADQKSSSYYNTTGSIVVEFVNLIQITTWQNNSFTLTNYSDSVLIETLNTTIYNSLSIDFKNVIKTFSAPTSTQINSTSTQTTSVEYPSQLLHSANAKEVGYSNILRPSENSASFTFDYYLTDAKNRRIKSGESTTIRQNCYWLRSLSKKESNQYLAVWVGAGGAIDVLVSSIELGVAPIAVI